MKGGRREETDMPCGRYAKYLRRTLQLLRVVHLTVTNPPPPKYNKEVPKIIFNILYFCTVPVRTDVVPIFKFALRPSFLVIRLNIQFFFELLSTAPSIFIN